MRKLLGDAFEAAWLLLTAPLRRLFADAIGEALDCRADSVTLQRCPHMDTGCNGSALTWGAVDPVTPGPPP